MTDTSHFDYEALSNDALRGVVKTVLTRVAKTGLPGNHHFFIGFDTQAEGVHISKRLLEKYPAEMTIVLQHRFWDLTVLDDRFEVKLSFDAIPERLVVPFSSIKVFFDPSVPYGLQFGEPDAERTTSVDTEQRPQRGGAPVAAAQKKRSTKKSKTDRAADDVPQIQDLSASGKKAPPRVVAEDNVSEPAAAAPAPKPVEVPASGDTKVISLDQFRKK